MAASIPCKEVIISHFVVLNYEIRQKYAYLLTMGQNGSQWTKLQKIYSGKNILKRPLCMSHLEWAVLKKKHFEIHILYENIVQFNSIKISRNIRLTFNLVSSYSKSSIYYLQIDVIRHIDIFFPLSRLQVCTPTRNHYISGKKSQVPWNWHFLIKNDGEKKSRLVYFEI